MMHTLLVGCVSATGHNLCYLENREDMRRGRRLQCRLPLVILKRASTDVDESESVVERGTGDGVVGLHVAALFKDEGLASLVVRTPDHEDVQRDQYSIGNAESTRIDILRLPEKNVPRGVREMLLAVVIDVSDLPAGHETASVMQGEFANLLDRHVRYSSSSRLDDFFGLLIRDCFQQGGGESVRSSQPTSTKVAQAMWTSTHRYSVSSQEPTHTRERSCVR